MSFTSELKKEIIGRGVGKTRVCQKAAISAFVRTSGFVGKKDGKPSFFIVSETENVAEFFMSAFSENFNTELSVTNATMDRMSGRDKLLLQCPPQYAECVLKELKLLQDDGKLTEGLDDVFSWSEQECIAYAKGAFLGSGSCTVPGEGSKSGYHLEFVFLDGATARDFCDLLSGLELFARLRERKDTFIVYMKSKETISDFLSVIGANKTLKKFSALVDERDKANQSNRAQNCMAGNADKSAIASVKQVVAFEKLRQWSGFTDLSEELQAAAIARLEHTDKTLQELADYLKVSKSCLNHRMRKLMELSAVCENK